MFADDNFKLNENGKKFSNRVENTEGKGEIACYEQFFLFPTVFSKDIYSRRKNQGLFGKGLKVFVNYKIQATKELKSFMRREEHIVGKGENYGFQQFLLFP